MKRFFFCVFCLYPFLAFSQTPEPLEISGSTASIVSSSTRTYTYRVTSAVSSVSGHYYSWSISGVGKFCDVFQGCYNWSSTSNNNLKAGNQIAVVFPSPGIYTLSVSYGSHDDPDSLRRGSISIEVVDEVTIQVSPSLSVEIGDSVELETPRQMRWVVYGGEWCSTVDCSFTNPAPSIRGLSTTRMFWRSNVAGTFRIYAIDINSMRVGSVSITVTTP